MHGIAYVTQALAAFATTPSFAQSPPYADDADGRDIIVQGTRIPERQVEQFVRALTEAPVGGQISRFDWAACPAAVGQLPAQNDAIVSRIRRVAEAAGAPVGKPDCTPNAFLIVVDDKKHFIKSLRSQYPAYFTNALGGSIRIPKQKGPATAWHIEGRLDQNGVPATIIGTDDGGRFFQVAVTDSSRLNPASRPHFVGAVVVVERGALAGLTTTQVADYSAMRLLARTDPARLGLSAPPTVLTILDAPMNSAVPMTMTAWDFGFLKALYASRENQYANLQRSEMQRSLKEDLQGTRRKKD